jgi:ATP-dependent helicase/nuclease subunit B
VPFTVEPTPFGAPALDALGRLIRNAQAGRPLAPVTVIVPTNVAGVTARRALARSGGIAAVQFLTVYRLADRLAGHHLVAQGRRPLTTPVLNATIRSVLADEPGAFRPVSEHEATVEGLRLSYRELRELPPRFLDVLSRSGSAMAAEVVRVVNTVNGRLWQRWHDETDLLLAATNAAEQHGLGEFGTIIAYLPEPLSSAAQDLLATCARLGELIVLTGTHDDTRADAAGRRLVAALADRCGVDSETMTWPPAVGLASVVEVASTSDADDEVRVAVRDIVRAARDGVAFERIAVLWTSDDPYRRAMSGALSAAGIPWNGPNPTQLTERLAGRVITGLLELDRFGLRRRDLFAWLATTPVRDEQGRTVPVAAWERISREAGVAGKGDWDAKLERFGSKRAADAVRARQAGRESQALRAERDTAEAGDLARFVGWIQHELATGATHRSWDRWGGWAHRMLQRLIGGTIARGRLPDAEQLALDSVDQAIDRLRGLDEIVPGTTRTGFAAALGAELEAATSRIGRIGDGVLLGPLGGAIGLTAELTIVLGAVDGRLPASPGSDPLIGDHDRALVPLLRSSADSVDAQRRQLIAALRSAPRVVIGAPRGDLRRSAVQTPSRWIDELVPGECRRDVHHSSFAAGIGAVDFPANDMEHRTRTLLAHARAGGAVDTHPLATDDRSLARAVAMIRARASAEFTEYDGNLAGMGPGGLFDGEVVLSATQLERWASCPHRYFIERVLGVATIEDRDDDLRMSPLDRGSLIHDVFDRFLQQVLSGVLPMPSAEQPWSPMHRQAAMEVLDLAMSEAEQAGLTGRSLLWGFDRGRLRSEVQRWLDRDNTERATRQIVPVGSEQRFGYDDSPWPPAAVELPSGRILRFRGSIDRLDQRADGTWFITDHKTGSGSQYSSIKETNPIDRGRRLQLGVYAAAVAAAAGTSPVGVTTEYSFTNALKGPTRRGYAVSEEIWEVFIGALETIVDAIDSGVFAPRPIAPSNIRPWIECPVCDPDGLGTADAYRLAERKADDPRLSALRVLDESARS